MAHDNPRFLMLSVAFSLSALSGLSQAQDIYIGTIEFKKNSVELRRCDVGGNHYVLLDPKEQKEGAVKQLKNKHSSEPAPLYGEVIGTYQGKGGKNQIVVQSVENLTPGKSCHLADAVSDLEKLKK